MDLFKQILLEAHLLTELKDGNDDNIIKAINGVRRARIVYNDGTRDRKGKNERYILPVAYGINKNGHKVIRAFETFGSSKRGLTNPPNNREFPQWKLFRLDRIVSWTTGNKSFKNELSKLKNQGLNMNGDDESMVDLYAISPLCGKPSKPLKYSNELPINSEPITKIQVQPELEKEISAKTVDISKENPQIYGKEVPPTEPATKTDINPDYKNEPEAPEVNYKTDAINTEPMTKDTVENGGIPDKKPEENPFDKSLDLMNRMDNLGNEEDENNEEDSDEDNKEENI